jgi:hypothetical protein
VRNLKDRVDRLERDADGRVPTTQCDHCRDWPFVCVKQVEVDGAETWKTERPQECPRCGWVAEQVVFHILTDWRSVTPKPGRGR